MARRAGRAGARAASAGTATRCWCGATSTIEHAEPVDLPTLEPRGAVRADLVIEGRRVRVLGMHLDLSGLRRRDQISAILRIVDGCESACPTVLMGDFNQWGRSTGALREFAARLAACWRSATAFPAARPVAPLDRIVHSPEWTCQHAAVHHSALAAVALGPPAGVGDARAAA